MLVMHMKYDKSTYVFKDKGYNKLDEKKIREKALIEQIRRYIEGIDTKGRPNKTRLNENKNKTLWKFYNSLRAGDSTKVTSLKSVLSYINVIKNFGLFLEEEKKEVNDFINVQKQDIVDYVAQIQRKGYDNNKPLSASTISYYRFIVKIFFRWLYQTGKEWPEIVAWIPDKTSNRRIIEPDKLLSNSDLRKMIECCDHIRDKTVIIVCYEGALRVGELTGIKIRDVVLRDGFCEITVDGKTGKRVLPLVDSQPYLEKWLNSHPFRSNKDSPLFINLSNSMYGRQIRRSGVRGILEKSSKMAEVDKKVFPHLLRHSRLTQMAEQGYNERDLRMYAGWNDDSEMPNVYLHYGYEGLKNKILTKKERLSNNERARQIREQNANVPKECPRCKDRFPDDTSKWLHPSDALYCHCGMALDLRTVDKELRRREAGDSILNKIVNNPELNKEFLKLIQKAQD